MKTKVILAGVLACIGISAQAQNVQTEEPKGKAIVQVFGNFHTGFGAENNDRGFELDRSYLGYEYNFGNGLSTKAVMDIGKSSDVSDYQRIAYIKNAMVSWKKGGLTLNGGLISTTQFNFQKALPCMPDSTTYILKTIGTFQKMSQPQFSVLNSNLGSM